MAESTTGYRLDAFILLAGAGVVAVLRFAVFAPLRRLAVQLRVFCAPLDVRLLLVSVGLMFGFV